jgi:hypothetical protein
MSPLDSLLKYKSNNVYGNINNGNYIGGPNYGPVNTGISNAPMTGPNFYDPYTPVNPFNYTWNPTYRPRYSPPYYPPQPYSYPLLYPQPYPQPYPQYIPIPYPVGYEDDGDPRCCNSNMAIVLSNNHHSHGGRRRRRPRDGWLMDPLALGYTDLGYPGLGSDPSDWWY